VLATNWLALLLADLV